MVPEAKVKEEVVDEVVQVEVKEMVEEKVKEEVEEKVVEEKVTGGGGVVGEFFWRAGGRGHHGPTMGPCHPAGSPTPKPQPLPAGPPVSPIETICFLMHRAHHKFLGQGRWVWANEGGIHQYKPLCVGGVAGDWWWQEEMPWGKGGQTAPPSDKGVKMFELVQFNIFTPDVKKGGPSISGSFACVCRPWDWGVWISLGVRGSGPRRGRR